MSCYLSVIFGYLWWVNSGALMAYCFHDQRRYTCRSLPGNAS